MASNLTAQVRNIAEVATDLPPEKQQMLERLNSSDEDLVNRTVLRIHRRERRRPGRLSA
jgi:hypothetical protein